MGKQDAARSLLKDILAIVFVLREKAGKLSEATRASPLPVENRRDLLVVPALLCHGSNCWRHLGFLILRTVSPAELSPSHPAVVGLVPLSWNRHSVG